MSRICIKRRMRLPRNVALICPAAAVSLALVTLLASAPSRAQTVLFAEDFNSVSSLTENGWTQVNRSPSPDQPWFQGNTDALTSQAGTPDAYVAVNYASTSSTASSGVTISNWLILPTLTLQNGDSLQFYTRTVDGADIPDRLEVRLSANGSSANVGSTPTSVGDFSNLLLTVNPNLQPGPASYPDTWTPFTVSITGLNAPASARLAFRYFVTDAGANGSNSNYIGVDTVRVTHTVSAAAPEPATIEYCLLMSSFGLLWRGIFCQSRKREKV